MTVFLILLVLALVVLGAMCYVYRMAFHPVPTKRDRSAKALNNPQFRAQREHINQLIADMEARPYELVSIVARDGVRLTGRYYHQADGASPVQLETFPNAEHGLSYLTDTPRYEGLIRDFIEKIYT